MDLDEFRTIVGNSGVGIWGLLETAIKVASLDHKDELVAHRDGIVAQLYSDCTSCDSVTRVRTSSGIGNAVFEAGFGVEEEGQNKGHSPYTPMSIGRAKVEEEEGLNKEHSPYTPVSIGVNGVEEEQEEGEHVYKEKEQRFVDDDDDDDDDEEDEYDEERRIISIKEQIEDPHQSEASVVDLLQTLADMEITFKALKETDIGRHVNRLRKHPSNDVKRLVKLLVRKWKDLVDDWVSSNPPGDRIVDGDSPQKIVSKNQQNNYNNQVPDFGYSPNPHNGSSGSDKSEYKPKVVPAAHAPPSGRNPPNKPVKSASPASAPPSIKQKQVAVDPDRLASARKRLQENYQEAQNAKKQRTIQVMEINEIPKGKAKSSFFGRNKGGFQRH